MLFWSAYKANIIFALHQILYKPQKLPRKISKVSNLRLLFLSSSLLSPLNLSSTYTSWYLTNVNRMYEPHAHSTFQQ